MKRPNIILAAGLTSIALCVSVTGATASPHRASAACGQTETDACKLVSGRTYHGKFVPNRVEDYFYKLTIKVPGTKIAAKLTDHQSSHCTYPAAADQCGGINLLLLTALQGDTVTNTGNAAPGGSVGLTYKVTKTGNYLLEIGQGGAPTNGHGKPIAEAFTLRFRY